MAARPPSYIYLRNHLSSQFQIQIIDSQPSGNICFQMLSLSAIQYGHEATSVVYNLELYLKNHMSNQFKILTVDCNTPEDVNCQSASRSGIQLLPSWISFRELYLENYFSNQFKISIGLNRLVPIKRCDLSNFQPIKYQICLTKKSCRYFLGGRLLLTR